MSLLDQAVISFKSGDKATAMKLLIQCIGQDPNNEFAWLYLAACVEEPEKRIDCLKRVLKINPNNIQARQALERLQPAPKPPTTPNIPLPQTQVNPKAINQEAIKPHSGMTRSQIITMLLFVVIAGIVLFFGGRYIYVLQTAPTQTLPPLVVIPTQTHTPRPTREPVKFPATWTPEPSATPIPIELLPSSTPELTPTPIVFGQPFTVIGNMNFTTMPYLLESGRHVVNWTYFGGAGEKSRLTSAANWHAIEVNYITNIYNIDYNYYTGLLNEAIIYGDAFSYHMALEGRNRAIQEYNDALAKENQRYQNEISGIVTSFKVFIKKDGQDSQTLKVSVKGESYQGQFTFQAAGDTKYQFVVESSGGWKLEVAPP